MVDLFPRGTADGAEAYRIIAVSWKKYSKILASKPECSFEQTDLCGQ